MRDFDLTNTSGYLNIEYRTDGGITISIDAKDSWKSIALTKDEMIKMAGWLITYIENMKET